MDGRDDVVEGCEYVNPTLRTRRIRPLGLIFGSHEQLGPLGSTGPGGFTGFEPRGTLVHVPWATSARLRYERGRLAGRVLCVASPEETMRYRLRLLGGDFGPENIVSGHAGYCNRSTPRHLLDIHGNGVLELLAFNIYRPKTGNEWDALYFDESGPVGSQCSSQLARRCTPGSRWVTSTGMRLPDLYEVPDVDWRFLRLQWWCPA